MVDQSEIGSKLKILKVLCIQNAADTNNNPTFAQTGPIQAQNSNPDYFDCAADQWEASIL